MLIAGNGKKRPLEGLRSQVFGKVSILNVREAECVDATHVQVIDLAECSPIVAGALDELLAGFGVHLPLSLA